MGGNILYSKYQPGEIHRPPMVFLWCEKPSQNHRPSATVDGFPPGFLGRPKVPKKLAIAPENSPFAWGFRGLFPP